MFYPLGSRPLCHIGLLCAPPLMDRCIFESLPPRLFYQMVSHFTAFFLPELYFPGYLIEIGLQ
jgi:hypothetical protein